MTNPTAEAIAPVWPEELMIRDTGLYDDIGGGGQRIYTTAGRGYEKRKYILADASRAARAPPAVGEGDAGYAPGNLDATAPARIWLQIDTGGDNDERTQTWPGPDEVTWQDESIGGLEIEYVRADLANTAPPSREVGDAVMANTLTEIRDVLASSPIDCLGTGTLGNGQEYPIRDEVIDGITKALSATPTQPPVQNARDGDSGWAQIRKQYVILMAQIEARFKSGNSVPVERVHITANEWSLIDRYEDAAEHLSNEQDRTIASLTQPPQPGAELLIHNDIRRKLTVEQPGAVVGQKS